MNRFLALLPLLITLVRAAGPFLVQNPHGEAVRAEVKVPVQLGVMSRCPDAILCENLFDQVLKKVAGKVDISLIYIATLNSSDPDFGATCKHGPEECAGNVQQLCAAKYTPLSSWWEFVHCNNFNGRNKIGLPETALRCAQAAKIDWESSGVGECAGLDASGTAAEGVKLFHESIALAQIMELQKSCTVVISGEKVCIHDDTWKECENGHSASDFVRQINQEYDRLNDFVQ